MSYVDAAVLAIDRERLGVVLRGASGRSNENAAARRGRGRRPSVRRARSIPLGGVVVAGRREVDVMTIGAPSRGRVGDHEDRGLGLGRATLGDQRDRDVACRAAPRWRLPRRAGSAAPREPACEGTSCPTWPSVPRSLAWIGSYWPAGHHAHASRHATAARERDDQPRGDPGAHGSTRRPARPRPRTQAPGDDRDAQHRQCQRDAGAGPRRAPRRTCPSSAWRGIAASTCEPLAHVLAASFGSSRIAPTASASSTGTITSTHEVTSTRARPVSAEASRAPAGQQALEGRADVGVQVGHAGRVREDVVPVGADDR